MARPLMEYFGRVDAADIYPYGHGRVAEFLAGDHADGSYDWVITNPPFRLAEEFILHALLIARIGVAILARTVFLKSGGRHKRIFRPHPPTKVAQFAERVPMIKGRLDKRASTATGYAWFVWENPPGTGTILDWIPPCRKRLERDADYEGEAAPPS